MNEALSINIPWIALILLLFSVSAVLIGNWLIKSKHVIKENGEQKKIISIDYFKVGITQKKNIGLILLTSIILGFGFVLVCNVYIHLRANFHFDSIDVPRIIVAKQGIGHPHVDSTDEVEARIEAYATAFSHDDTEVIKQFLTPFFENPKSEVFEYGDLNTGISESFLQNRGCKGPHGALQVIVAKSANQAACENHNAFGTYIKESLMPNRLWGYPRVTPHQIRMNIKPIDTSIEVKIAGTDNVDVKNNEILMSFIEGYVRQIQDAMFPMIRTSQMIAGPVQLVTFILYFFGLILATIRLTYIYEKIILFKDPRSNEETYLIKDYYDDVISVPLNFVLWVLPTIGFIGTVIGISKALGDADKVVVAKGIMEQSDAINVVTSLLSEAFDTTLIALVCSIPVFVFAYWTSAKESKIILTHVDNPELNNPRTPNP